jgi:hypothetical protein
MGWKRIGGMSLGVVLTAALALAQPAADAAPGAVNYLEGQASIDGRPFTARSARLERGQVLETSQGNVELLLTPGVFLRVGHDSSLRMISPGLANTEVALLRGTAMLEVDQLFKQNNLKVIVDGMTARIQKTGLYEFDANQPAAMVFEGQASVLEGGREVKVKGGRELLLADAALEPQKFDKHAAEQEPLYRWSKLRSEYESEAGTEMARNVYLYGGWYGPGWYWDPYWNYYAWLPAYGPYYGPFGYPYFGPGFGIGISVGGFHGHEGHFERGFERREAHEHFEGGHGEFHGGGRRG